MWMHQPLVRTELGTDTRFDGFSSAALWQLLPTRPGLFLLALPQADSLGRHPGCRCLLFTFLYRNEVFDTHGGLLSRV